MLFRSTQLLRFEHPADQVVARYFREQRSLGPRERTIVSDTVYAILRRKRELEAQAKAQIHSGSSPSKEVERMARFIPQAQMKQTLAKWTKVAESGHQ